MPSAEFRTSPEKLFAVARNVSRNRILRTAQVTTARAEVEVVVDDQLLDPAVGAIVAAARTGEAGDGRVFVFPIEHTYRIRTGEVDVA